MIEIQVRTSLQHLWAEVSGKFSDVVDPVIKYGGGGERIRELLTRTSNLVASVELSEKRLAGFLARPPLQDQLPEDLRQEIAAIREDLSSGKQDLTELLTGVIARMEAIRRGRCSS